MFHHDLQHMGRSPYTGPSIPNEKWSFATGGSIVTSSPSIVADGTIYIGGSGKKLHAINPDGTEKWSFLTGNSILSSPAIAADGTIYIGFNDNNLYAINPDGSLKWSFATAGVIGSAPAIGDDGTIYVGSNNNLYAINPDGTLKWSFLTDFIQASSPGIGADGTIYVAGNGYLYAINPDGTLKWSFATGAGIWHSSPAIAADGTLKWSFATGGLMSSSPALGTYGTVYVGSKGDNLYAINPDGTLKWSFTTGGSIVSSPAIGADGTIYVGSRDTNLYAINPDGTLKWSSYTGDQLSLSSPAIAADGTLYVGSGDSNLYAFNPDGTLKWGFTTGTPVASSPAIGADGTIYMGTGIEVNGRLLAINPDGTLKWSFFMGPAVWGSPAIAADGTIYVGSFDYKLYAIEQQPTTVVVASGSAEPGQTALLDVTVQYIADPDGLGAYDLRVDFTPGVLDILSIQGGDPPFNNSPIQGIFNAQGFAVFNFLQVSQAPGPTGDIVVARIEVQATGNVEDSTPLDLSISSLVDVNGDPIAAVDLDGAFDVIGTPDINVAPLLLSEILDQDSMVVTPLTIGNGGNADLTWSLAENPAAPWLSEAPTGGTLPPAVGVIVDVTFDSTGLLSGIYNTILDITRTTPSTP